ncbi:MAG TPA: TetR family transcriptional regulator [Stackebrandtia sp.]|jgi:AcrR family transcriptional regulator|uniref:TetR family transcriptional regulator n=1 Tax=Stackebrandtia sp. TaxID=2023065 RepID=UPI002D38DE02|nr:TetR family transcriptional regulator [Stackebrandtia sp.]HZE38520.1 TetR family transcriptional regulator [Stackebrandtia sp.]
MGRAEIGVAALRLLNIDPTASMAQLAAAAGVSRATMHRHFATREELVKHLGWLSLRSWRDALDAARIDEAVDSGDTARAREALDGLCRELVRDAAEYGFTLTEHSLESDDDIVSASEIQAKREYAFYVAAQDLGVIRADLPVPWIANAVFGLLVGLRRCLSHGDIAVRDAERLLRETLLGGIGA